jgi:hypothetical protein
MNELSFKHAQRDEVSIYFPNMEISICHDYVRYLYVTMAGNTTPPGSLDWLSLRIEVAHKSKTASVIKMIIYK